MSGHDGVVTVAGGTIVKSKKARERKRRERAMAKAGQMNDAQGNYKAIGLFTKDGMQDGYAAGYRIEV